MTKVTKDPIGMFQRTTLALSKQRASGGKADAAQQASSLSGIQDKITLSSTSQSESIAQALTKGVASKGFSSVKEYGAYTVQLFKQLKKGGGDS